MKKTVDIHTKIIDENTKLGLEIQNILNRNSIIALNIMASPGAGKTSLIGKTIEKLKDTVSIGVVEGDIVPIDVERLRKLRIPVVLAHTGGACHLDSIMMNKALSELPLNHIDLLIVENVGNLVCPASFYLGTHKNIVIASVPEGDDKPLKYPSMFATADLVILNKSDYLQHEEFNLNEFNKAVQVINASASILPVSCKTGEGLNHWIAWIEKELKSPRV